MAALKKYYADITLGQSLWKSGRILILGQFEGRAKSPSNKRIQFIKTSFPHASCNFFKIQACPSTQNSP